MCVCVLYFHLYEFTNLGVGVCMYAFWLTVLPGRRSMMLSTSGHMSHLCPLSDFKGNAFSGSLLNTMFEVVYSFLMLIACFQLKETSLYL